MMTLAAARPPPQFEDGDVKILSGTDEGAFAWLTLNYLLGHLGGSEHDTGAPPPSGPSLTCLASTTCQPLGACACCAAVGAPERASSLPAPPALPAQPPDMAACLPSPADFRPLACSRLHRPGRRQRAGGVRDDGGGGGGRA